MIIWPTHNRDYNIDQNNRDYDFCHNRAALPALQPFINLTFLNLLLYMKYI